jgi:hypothetical protein
MSEYVYLPDFDGEFSVMTTYEYSQTGGVDVYGKAEPVNQVLDLSSNRGISITPDFIDDACSLLARNGVDKLSADERAKLIQAKQHATTYNDHQMLGAEGTCDPLCSACEFIFEDSQTVEYILSDHGYIVEWFDGNVAVYEPAEC